MHFLYAGISFQDDSGESFNNSLPRYTTVVSVASDGRLWVWAIPGMSLGCEPTLAAGRGLSLGSAPWHPL